MWLDLFEWAIEYSLEMIDQFREWRIIIIGKRQNIPPIRYNPIQLRNEICITD